MTTNQQQAYLFEALNIWRNTAKNEIGGPYAGRLPEARKPASVKRAEAQIERLQRVVARWEAKASKAHKAAMRGIEKQYAEARKQILFGDPKAALKFIDSL